MHFLSFYTVKTIDVMGGFCEMTRRSDVTSHKPCNITLCRVLYNVTSGKPCNIIPIRRTMHLSSVIPANDTKESVFGQRNFSRHEWESNLGPLAPEASGLPLSYHASSIDIHRRHVFIHTCIHAPKRRRCIILLNISVKKL